MTAFTKLKGTFGANWTTVLVGWKGVGPLAWPERWTEFPSLLSAEEIAAYAEEQLTSSSVRTEKELIAEILSWNLRNQGRESVKDILDRLSDLDCGDPPLELRKWRVALVGPLFWTKPR